MEFDSDELKNASFVPANGLSLLNENIDFSDIKNQLKLGVLIKDKKLIKWFENYSMRQYKASSGVELLIELIKFLREEFIFEHRENNIKNLTARKTFDTILLSLELLIINKAIF